MLMSESMQGLHTQTFTSWLSLIDITLKNTHDDPWRFAQKA